MNPKTRRNVSLRSELRRCRSEYNRLAKQAAKIELRRQRIILHALEICRILDTCAPCTRESTDHWQQCETCANRVGGPATEAEKTEAKP